MKIVGYTMMRKRPRAAAVDATRVMTNLMTNLMANVEISKDTKGAVSPLEEGTNCKKVG